VEFEGPNSTGGAAQHRRNQAANGSRILPLPYVLATRQPRDAVTFPVEGADGGSVSMLAVKLG
jgi:4,5-DOPA dioxygenase extradiol